MMLYEIPNWLLDICIISGGMFLFGIGLLCFSLALLVLFFIYQLLKDFKLTIYIVLDVGKMSYGVGTTTGKMLMVKMESLVTWLVINVVLNT